MLKTKLNRTNKALKKLLDLEENQGIYIKISNQVNLYYCNQCLYGKALKDWNAGRYKYIL